MLVSHLVLLLTAISADLQYGLAKACHHVCNLPLMHTQQYTYHMMIRYTSNHIYHMYKGSGLGPVITTHMNSFSNGLQADSSTA